MRVHLLLSGLSLLAALPVAKGQVPNGNFETWNDFGTYNDPSFWSTTNAVAINFGAAPTCERVQPGWEGLACVKVTNQAAPNGVVVHGKVVSGTSGNYGFPFSGRPSSLSGRCQYGLPTFNIGQVKVFLSRWDSVAGLAIPVGSGSINFTGTATEWQNFNVPIGYVSSYDPDTAVITVTAAAGLVLVTEGAYLQVDDFKFVFSGTGMTEQAGNRGLAVRPTLAHDLLEVAAGDEMSGAVVLDALGRPVLRRALSGRAGTVALDGLAAGRYFLEVRFPDGELGRLPFVKY